MKIKTYAKNIAIAVGVGLLSALITRGDMKAFNLLNKPSLAPPAFLFPIVWSILYVLMGISYSLASIYGKNKTVLDKATTCHYLQLLFNFAWSVWFFKLNAFLFSFIWLLILLFLIIKMTVQFFKLNRLSAYLQIPYILWVIFAGYLNFMYFLLN